MSLPLSTELSQLSYNDKVAVLDNLFEPCETLTRFLISQLFSNGQSYSSYKELIESARDQLLEYLKQAESTIPIKPEIAQIIAAHPRLGASAKLSEHSSNEQKSLQGTQQEAQRLKELNNQYEQTFPGLRFVVFVNGRPRSEIMENMRQRIERNDIRLERVEAFNAMCDIALDRAQKLGAKL